MKSVILQTATRLLVALILLFSVVLLVRGHNHPGGGFAGGMVAGSAFALYAMAFDVRSARRALTVPPQVLLGVGFIVALASALPAVLIGRPFMKGLWVEFQFPGGSVIALGTPLLFDVGVYLLVAGAVLTILFALEDE